MTDVSDSTSADRTTQLHPPGLTHLFTLRARLAASLDAGDGPLGRRALNAIAEGDFLGPRLQGKLNPGTGDWMLTRNRIRVIDARVVLVTDDGAFIHMSYGGRATFPQTVESALRDKATRHRVDPASYYFRIAPLFETGAEKYLWLNGIVSVGSGRLIEGGVAYDVFELT